MQFTGPLPDVRDNALTSQHPLGVENMPIHVASGQMTMSNGIIWMAYFTPSKGITVSKIGAIAKATAAAGTTLARMGLYDCSGATPNLLARTASDTTLFNTINTYNERAFNTTGGFPATVDLQPGKRYGFGFIVVGTTTAPVLNGIGVSAVGILYGTTFRPAAFAGSGTGQTDLTQTPTMTQTTPTNGFWAAAVT